LPGFRFVSKFRFHLKYENNELNIR